MGTKKKKRTEKSFCPALRPLLPFLPNYRRGFETSAVGRVRIVECACKRINTSLVQINGMCLSPTLVAKASSSSSHFSFGPAAHGGSGGLGGGCGGGIGGGSGGISGVGIGGGVGAGGVVSGGGFYGGGVRCGVGRTTEPVRRSRSQGGQRNKLQKCLSTVSYSDDGLAVANTRTTLYTAVDRHNLLATRQYCSFGSTNRHL